jgi:hypothetical protein
VNFILLTSFYSHPDPHQTLLGHADPQLSFPKHNLNNQQNSSYFQTAYHNGNLITGQYINLVYLFVNFILYTSLYPHPDPHQTLLGHADPQLLLPSYKHNIQLNSSYFQKAYHNGKLTGGQSINSAYLFVNFILFPSLYIGGKKTIKNIQQFLPVPVPSVPVPTGTVPTETLYFQISGNNLLLATVSTLGLICNISIRTNIFKIETKYVFPMLAISILLQNMHINKGKKHFLLPPVPTGATFCKLFSMFYY